MKRRIETGFLVGTSMLVLGLAGCASAPMPDPSLTAAASQYQRASTDPEVVQHGQLELQSAHQALEQAQSVWRDEGDKAVVDHLAYLASHHAEIAQQQARLASAQAIVASAPAQRADAILSARNEELQQANQRADTEQQRVQSLEQQLDTAKKGGAAVLTLNGDILFDVGKADLKPGAYDEINQVATVLKAEPNRQIQVKGFTDNTGSAEFNMTLSAERANAVRQALISAGVSGDQLTTQGLGDSNPVASNQTDAGRQLNRRVEIVISENKG